MNGTWLSVSLNNTFINDYEVTWLEYIGRLSSPECVRVKIVSSLSLSEVTAALNSPMNVVIQNAEQSWMLNLMLFKVDALLGHELMGRNCYMLELYSPVYDLSCNRITPVLKKVSLSAACELLLSGQFTNSRSAGLQSYRMNIANCDVDHPLPLVKGLNESLLSFWQRLLSVYGLSYAFDQTDSGMMVISDNLASFAPPVSIMQNTYAEGDLLTTPHYEQAKKMQKVSSADVLTAGHPRAAPETLLASNSISQFKGLPYQADFNEFNESEADLHATLLYQAKQGEANRNYYIGGGIVFPGMLDSERQELLIEAKFTLEFDAHEQNRVRAIPLTVVSQPIAFPYHDRPILLENHSMLFHGGTISDVTGNPNESVSVSSEGHYHVLLPEFVTDNLSSVPVVDTRMVYPMQSDDHSQHFTLMNNSEGLLLYDATPLGESLLLGTGNSGGATHITNQDTAQNQYWQDASQNKQAFINEGTYDPTQQTGRATAQIMEAPNYHPDGSSSYMRMGDPIQNDSSYPSQAGESGMFMATTGHYQEEHQGGMLQMAGNAGTDSSNPIPVSREMTQLNPVGTPNILQSSTANLHNNLMTTSTVNYTNELTEGTLTEALTSPSLFNSWTTDNTSQIFVNQDLQQTGNTTTLTLNNQNSTLTTPANNITQVGAQRTDQITNSSITQNHSNNVLQYQTWEKSTTTGQEQITTQNVNVPNLTRNTQNGTVQASNFNTTASSFSSATSTTYISSLVMNGSSSGSGPSPLMQAHQATLSNQNQQQTDQKKEIVFNIDDPHHLISSPPILSVNAQSAITLSSNSVTTYPLPTQDYKTGPISLAWQADEGTLESIINPNIRHFNVYNPDLQMQLPKAYFTNQGKLPISIGTRKIKGVPGIDFDDQHDSAVMIAGNSTPPIECQATGTYNLNNCSDQMIFWLMETLSIVNSSTPQIALNSGSSGSSSSGWVWAAPTAVDYANISAETSKLFLVKQFREFLGDFFFTTDFSVKEVRGSWMLVFKGKPGLRKWVHGTMYSLESTSSSESLAPASEEASPLSNLKNYLGEAFEFKPTEEITPADKIKVFKVYAQIRAKTSLATKAGNIADSAADGIKGNTIIAAPIEMVRYFFFDNDQNKQISDLFVNIGFDVFNGDLGYASGVAAAAILVGLLPFEVAAGFVILAGIALGALFGWIYSDLEENFGITETFVELGRDTESFLEDAGDALANGVEALSNEIGKVLGSS